MDVNENDDDDDAKVDDVGGFVREFFVQHRGINYFTSCTFSQLRGTFVGLDSGYPLDKSPYNIWVS